ncbi:YoaK family protein [Methyloradius palustris]|uniref:DUF1275 family protein n=1 Tax=Methyloradius palustris TaxID=2778876 RepID=A0A8D5GDF4_9PROT|nr:YoaK family protein [Methyloradius palustris]BCM24579.1 DUF1275 family protein [Methyloradius palustris]
MINKIRSLPIFGKSNILSFTGGFVDVVSFVALFGLFANHMTGNIVMIGVSVSNSSNGLVSKLLAIPVFIITVAATRLVITHYGSQSRRLIILLYMLQASFLTFFMLSGWYASPILNPDNWLALVTGIFAVMAMGIQNAQSRLIEPGQVPTTIMTGNMTQAVIDFVDIVTKNPVTANDAAKRFAIYGPAIVAFMIGAIAGAFLYKYWSFACLLVPILALIYLAATYPKEPPA